MPAKAGTPIGVRASARMCPHVSACLSARMFPSLSGSDFGSAAGSVNEKSAHAVPADAASATKTITVVTTLAGERMKVLLTNDDGVDSAGLFALKEALSAASDVVVIAPDRNWSTSGHNRTLDRPMRVFEVPLRDGSTALVLEAEGAILKWRDTMGATDPKKAAPGTVRHDLGTSIGNNCTHGSDAPETAAFEIGYFFSGLELI